MQLSPIRLPNAAEALDAALALRAAGRVPLIIDPRADLPDDVLGLELPETAAWAALTSGTMGQPKIVVRSAASWQVAFDPLCQELGVSAGDGVWLPVHQVSSMALFTAAWASASGLELVIPTPDARGLDRASIAHLTPQWLARLLELLEAGEGSTIHTALVGGDALDPVLADRARRLGLRVVHYAGAAELSFVAWDIDEEQPGHGLRAFPGVETKILDGQLWVAGPQLALDVLGGTLRTQHLSGRTWATVGDRVTRHDGVFTFHGRDDGAILTAGATVIPADVEAVLSRHPHVNACLVLGQPDSILGQRVVAFIEGTAQTESLRAWVRTHLPKAARPVTWHLVTTLPRTVSGKIRRVAPEEP